MTTHTHFTGSHTVTFPSDTRLFCAAFAVGAGLAFGLGFAACLFLTAVKIVGLVTGGAA